MSILVVEKVMDSPELVYATLSFETLPTRNSPPQTNKHANYEMHISHVHIAESCLFCSLLYIGGVYLATKATRDALSQLSTNKNWVSVTRALIN
jgi:hypothetical protein